LPRRFPAGWFADAKLCADRHDRRLNFFGVNASQSLAEWRRNGWIDPQDARMASVVLPVVHGPEDARRRAADSAMAGDRAARRGHPEALRKRRRRLPTTAAAGRGALGL
jgi:hypothetical protein